MYGPGYALSARQTLTAKAASTRNVRDARAIDPLPLVKLGLLLNPNANQSLVNRVNTYRCRLENAKSAVQTISAKAASSGSARNARAIDLLQVVKLGLLNRSANQSPVNR